MEAGMIIAAMTFRLHAPWVHSLKEKRMVVKSIVAQLQNHFHVSAAEIDEQDTHQIIVIGADPCSAFSSCPFQESTGLFKDRPLGVRGFQTDHPV